MTDERFHQIDRLVLNSGHTFNATTGFFESSGEEDIHMDIAPTFFLRMFALTESEAVEYVTRKRRECETERRCT
jgi:hypothetical protein